MATKLDPSRAARRARRKTVTIAGPTAMTNRERQVELSKVVSRLEKAVRHRDVRALVVVALRHDGQYEHGTVVTGEDVGTLIATVGHALKGVVQELEGQQEPLDKQGTKG